MPELAKTVAYLSAEFVLGPHLENNILNPKLGEKVREAIAALGLDRSSTRARGTGSDAYE
jgi:starch phosphorylase